MNWFLFAILAAVVNTVYVILYTYMIRNKLTDYSNFDIIINFCIVIGIVGLIMFIFKRDRKIMLLDKNIISPKFVMLLIVSVSMLLLYAGFLIKSNKLVNNPSYTLSIINMNCILFLIISILVFKQKANIYSVLGMILLIIGMTLILVFNKSEKNMEMKLLDKIF